MTATKRFRLQAAGEAVSGMPPGQIPEGAERAEPRDDWSTAVGEPA